MLILSRTRFSFLAALFVITALLLAIFVAPASAAGKGQAAKAEKTKPAKSDSAQVVTEDNDANDGATPNNVVDGGDNAHPSGKDRSVEHGRSGNQGKAKADPDDDGRGPDRTNGGVDQPNRPGGVDKADQDGNNGCGNDDDFEDDNEGHCGRPSKPSKPAKPTSPSQPNEPSKPTKPTKPTKPAKPAKPGNNGGGNGGGNPGKVGICHATGSMTNPYVFINVSTNAADHGHAGHDRDIIGADSLADCPTATTNPTDPTDPKGPKDPVDPPKGDNDNDSDTDVGGVIIVRPPVDTDTPDNDDTVIIHQPRRPATPAHVITPQAEITARDRVLAATGSTTTTLAIIAALTLILGAGLLGIRRYAPKQ